MVIRDLFTTLTPLPRFPKTRYQGSKRKLLPILDEVFSKIRSGTAVDLYSGTGIVSLLLRFRGWHVHSNDYLQYNSNTSSLFLETSNDDIPSDAECREDLEYLLYKAPLRAPTLISDHYEDTFFSKDENLQIDRFCQNIGEIYLEKRRLYIYSVGQSLLMKRPYNLFHRANYYMRTSTVERSFGNLVTWNTSIIEHSAKAIKELRDFPFPSKKGGGSFNVNTQNLNDLPDSCEMIYMDPPYLNKQGRSEDYCNLYHFLDGLCNYELFSSGNAAYTHRPILQHESAWSTPQSGLEEILRVCEKWPSATIIMSYRSNGSPSQSEISECFISKGRNCEAHTASEYKYALSHATDTKELIFISRP